MEWDIIHFFEKKTIKVEAVARRDSEFLYFDHRIVLKCNSIKDIVSVVFEMYNWKDMTLYINER